MSQFMVLAHDFTGHEFDTEEITIRVAVGPFALYEVAEEYVAKRVDSRDYDHVEIVELTDIDWGG